MPENSEFGRRLRRVEAAADAVDTYLRSNPRCDSISALLPLASLVAGVQQEAVMLASYVSYHAASEEDRSIATDLVLSGREWLDEVVPLLTQAAAEARAARERGGQ